MTFFRNIPVLDLYDLQNLHRKKEKPGLCFVSTINT